MIAGFLEEPKVLAKNREYHSFLGRLDNKEILIVSHGVGSAGAAICFQELIDVGAKAIIRVGTAGGLYDDTRIGDVVVASGAVRKDGVSSLMVPAAYPAVPDFDLTLRLAKNFASTVSLRRGLILTSDLFYRGPLEDDLDFYRKARVIAVEMECATLFVIGQLRGVKTAAAVVLDGNPLKWQEGVYDPDPKRLQASVEASARAALTALAETEI
jgi:uridine phosphorylase